MTTAERVHAKFSTGLPMNELRTPQQAIGLAAALKQQLGEALKREGLNPDDCEVHTASLTPDLTVLLTHRFVGVDAENMKELHAKLTSVCAIPVGLLFAVRERDPQAIEEHGGPHMILGAKPFLSTKLVLEALIHRIESEQDLIAGGRTKAN